MYTTMMVEAAPVATVGARKAIVRMISPGAGNAADGHHYPREVLKAAAHKFGGSKCYFNHPADKQAASGRRDVRGWCGTFGPSEWYEGSDAPHGEIRATLKVYDPWLWDRIKVAPDEVAFSIRAVGTARTATVDGRQCKMAESIDAVDSVDVVHASGARGGVVSVLEEGNRSGYTFTESEMEEIRMDKIVAGRTYYLLTRQEGIHPAIAERIAAQFDESAYSDDATLLTAARAAAQAELTYVANAARQSSGSMPTPTPTLPAGAIPAPYGARPPIPAPYGMMIDGPGGGPPPSFLPIPGAGTTPGEMQAGFDALLTGHGQQANFHESVRQQARALIEQRNAAALGALQVMYGRKG